MRKTLDWLKKFNTPLYYGIACLVFGVAFIVLPFIAPVLLDILLVVAGICSIVLGVLSVIELETSDRSLSYYLNLIRTLLLIGFGLFLIIVRSSLAGSICLSFGIYVLVRSIPMLMRLVILPSTSDKSWWLRLILSILEILLGLWLVFYPAWPHILAGAMLLIVSVDLLTKHHKGKDSSSDSGSHTIFDPHFEDKS